MFFAFQLSMYKLLLVIIPFISLSSFSQEATAHEREILEIINKVRANPQAFLEEVVTPYIKLHDLNSSRYARSLMRDLRDQEAVTPLKIDSSLQKMAKSFAIRSGRRGQYGHNQYNQRFDRYGSHLAYDGENIQYGLKDPTAIVLDLLIDEGVPSLGHRKNILSPEFSVIGIGFAEHKEINYNTVMAFGGF